MLTFFALVVVHVRVLESSKEMVDGFAEKVTSGGGIRLFFLTSMVIEVPGLPLRKTIRRLVERSGIVFSKTVSLPIRKFRIEIMLRLRRRNPPLFFF
jgi:hypothetical protein